MEFNWVFKKLGKGSSAPDCDVYIFRSGVGSKEGSRIGIKFKKYSYNKITKNEYLVCAPVGTRLYFREGDSLNSFKLCNFRKDKSAGEIKMLERIMPITEYGIELGSYKLQFDRENNLYFIDVMNKIK